MKHKIKGRKLGRTASHRRATMRALATALLKYKKIQTTTAKAKELRSFVEPLITKARNNSVAARRYVAKYVDDREIVKELFNEIIPKIARDIFILLLKYRWEKQKLLFLNFLFLHLSPFFLILLHKCPSQYLNPDISILLHSFAEHAILKHSKCYKY